VKNRSPLLYLEDVITCTEKAIAFVEGFSESSFLADDRTVFAVIRCFEVIGEAANHIPSDTQQRFPAIPWRNVVGFRNFLYLGVKVDMVWISAKVDLPQTLPLFKAMYSVLQAEVSPI
jgi:uncharacterized protein with HEPN domain